MFEYRKANRKLSMICHSTPNPRWNSTKLLQKMVSPVDRGCRSQVSCSIINFREEVREQRHVFTKVCNVATSTCTPFHREWRERMGINEDKDKKENSKTTSAQGMETSLFQCRRLPRWRLQAATRFSWPRRWGLGT